LSAIVIEVGERFNRRRFRAFHVMWHAVARPVAEQPGAPHRYLSVAQTLLCLGLAEAIDDV
jgi:hypothetical protein